MWHKFIQEFNSTGQVVFNVKKQPDGQYNNSPQSTAIRVATISSMPMSVELN